MIKPYGELCAAMLRTGLLGYGGGPATVPLIRYEAVTKYGWMNDEEFGEVLAIANALPGPIATKLAAYLGYRIKGSAGAVVGVVAHIAPTCIAMIALYEFINFFSSSPVIKGMIAAVVPVVAVMLGQMAYEFGEKAVKGMGRYAALGLGIAVWVLLEFVKLHPAIVIVACLAYGSVHFKLVGKWKQARAGKGGI
ncbi:chromate transporter [Paenibacillus filicis]|uniref:Chromate transporter n=1 Tax=Paenibacillus filicis TaxID=669464 RepID=A0ABU9DIT2_9BACL